MSVTRKAIPAALTAALLGAACALSGAAAADPVREAAGCAKATACRRAASWRKASACRGRR